MEDEDQHPMFTIPLSMYQEACMFQFESINNDQSSHLNPVRYATKDGKKYAIKEISEFYKDGSKEDIYLDKFADFIQEITNQNLYKHPNILPVYGFIIFDEFNRFNPSIITEFQICGSLKDLIIKSHEDPPALDDTIKTYYAIAIANALSFLHQHNIIHMDLKPDNILISQNDEPLLMDFGKSSYLTPGDSLRYGIGTKLFSAPETLMNDIDDGVDRPAITEKVDIYSYAVVLYLLSENLDDPWKVFSSSGCKDVTEAIKEIINGKRLEFSDEKINQPIHRLIEECWRSEPDMRPSARSIVERFIENNALRTAYDSVDEKIVLERYQQLMQKVSAIEQDSQEDNIQTSGFKILEGNEICYSQVKNIQQIGDYINAYLGFSEYNYALAEEDEGFSNEEYYQQFQRTIDAMVALYVNGPDDFASKFQKIILNYDYVSDIDESKSKADQISKCTLSSAPCSRASTYYPRSVGLAAPLLNDEIIDRSFNVEEILGVESRKAIVIPFEKPCPKPVERSVEKPSYHSPKIIPKIKIVYQNSHKIRNSKALSVVFKHNFPENLFKRVTIDFSGKGSIAFTFAKS